MGNEIPLGEIHVEKAQKELHRRGFEFRRIKNGTGWYKNNEFQGRDWQAIFPQLDDMNYEDFV